MSAGQPKALIRIILPLRKLSPETARARPPAPYERQKERAKADKRAPGNCAALEVWRH
ncbi:hypothetical protein AA0483_1560 [Acetobacter syzygii NRIC 0483]|nr:hypothetical protein AA0483_1560 [Acetobacter syzygii NRIC 0483]